MKTIRKELDDDQLKTLSFARKNAPAGFTDAVMNRIRRSREMASTGWWPAGWRWLPPALAGAAAAAAIMIMFGTGAPTPLPTDRLTVQFELYAPAAESVELVGNFTHWQPGRIRLEGPDKTGHWSARVNLPEGRHEYLFLVDGEQWVTDPLAETFRSDGFGHMNAVMNL